MLIPITVKDGEQLSDTFLVLFPILLPAGEKLTPFWIYTIYTVISGELDFSPLPRLLHPPSKC